MVVDPRVYGCSQPPPGWSRRERSAGAGFARRCRGGGGSARTPGRSPRRAPPGAQRCRGPPRAERTYSATSSSSRGQLVDAALPGAGLLGQVAQWVRRCRAGPRSGAAAPAWPWGTAAARRSAAPRPRRTSRGCPTRGRRPARRRRCRSGPRSGDGSSAERGDQAGVGRRAGDRDRAGVRRVREQRAERHDLLDAELVRRGRAARCRTTASACSARCPRTSTTSRPWPGRRHTEIRVVGQVIVARRRRGPATTSGRLTWKS